MHPSPPIPEGPERRAALTAEVSARTGLTPTGIERFLRAFYGAARADALLGPAFDGVADWEAHIATIARFWSSVALMTGRYHGAPMPAHATLPVKWAHFDRWLDLFRQTATEVCPPAGAAHVIERAERIARSLHMAVEDTARGAGMTPSLR